MKVHKQMREKTTNVEIGRKRVNPRDSFVTSATNHFVLSHDLTSGSDVTPCNKIVML